MGWLMHTLIVGLFSGPEGVCLYSKCPLHRSRHFGYNCFGATWNLVCEPQCEGTQEVKPLITAPRWQWLPWCPSCTDEAKMTTGRAEVPGQEVGNAPYHHPQCCSNSRADPVQSKDLPSQPQLWEKHGPWEGKLQNVSIQALGATGQADGSSGQTYSCATGQLPVFGQCHFWGRLTRQVQSLCKDTQKELSPWGWIWWCLWPTTKFRCPMSLTALPWGRVCWGPFGLMKAPWALEWCPSPAPFSIQSTLPLNPMGQV